VSGPFPAEAFLKACQKSIIISTILPMANSIILIARSELPFGQLGLTAGNSGEEYEFGQGWRMFETEQDIPGTVADIAQALSRETGAPAIAGFAADAGYLVLVFCEKGKRTSTDIIIGGELAVADGFVRKYKHHPLSALGVGDSWAKKAGLKSSYDALKAAANREADPDGPASALVLTWLVGLGLPNCGDVDPYWNEIGDIAIAERKAFWSPKVEFRVDLDL
jgi:hypothetical protein